MRMFTKDDEGLSKQHRTLGRSVVLDSKKIEPDEYCEVWNHRVCAVESNPPDGRVQVEVFVGVGTRR